MYKPTWSCTQYRIILIDEIQYNEVKPISTTNIEINRFNISAFAEHVHSVKYVRLWMCVWVYIHIPRVPEKAERCLRSIFMTLLYSAVIFLTVFDRATISHHHDPKIIKFGVELLILWVLSFSAFARFPEFGGKITN